MAFPQLLLLLLDVMLFTRSPATSLESHDLSVMTLGASLTAPHRIPLDDGHPGNVSARIAQLIDKEHTDIVALQDIDEVNVRYIVSILGQPWRFVFQLIEGFGPAILTKHQVEARNSGPKFIYARIKHPMQTFDFFSIQLGRNHRQNLSFGPDRACAKGDSSAYWAERSSPRINQIKRIIRETNGRIFKGPTIIAGSLEAPSHLDWTEDLRSWHCGSAVSWPVTRELQKKGFLDAYRRAHPRPLQNPGHTWNVRQDAHRTEMQHRVDFIFFKNKGHIDIDTKEAHVVDRYHRRELQSFGQDLSWPSEHAAVFVAFEKLNYELDVIHERIRIMTFSGWQQLSYLIEYAMPNLLRHIRHLRPSALAIQGITRENAQELLRGLRMRGSEWDLVLGESAGPDDPYLNAVVTRHFSMKIHIGSSQSGGKVAAVRIRHPLATFDLYSVYIGSTPTDYSPNRICRASAGQSRLLCASAYDYEVTRRGFLARLLQRIHMRGGYSGLTFLAGLLSSPSHLDWTAATAASHCNCKLEWPVTKLLQSSGYKDVYRVLYTDPALHPGNTLSPVFKNSTPGKGFEPQDRIDYVFYANKSDDLLPQNVFTYCGTEINTPAPDYTRNEWPSTHCSVVADFAAKEKVARGDIEVMTLSTNLANPQPIKLTDTFPWNHVHRIAILIDKRRMDAVALQDINRTSLQYIRDYLGRPWKFYFKPSDPNAQGYGLGILTRHPVEKLMEGVNGRNEQIFLAARIKHPRLSFDFLSVRLANKSHGFAPDTACRAGESAAYSEEKRSARSHDLQALTTGIQARQFNGPTIIAGNFEVPSHLDWLEDVRSWHCGQAVAWPETRVLQQAGYIDAYRWRHHSVLYNAGSTWPFGFTRFNVTKDRLDYVFVKSPGEPSLDTTEALVLYEHWGKPGEAHHLVWPSDHSAVHIMFKIEDKKLVVEDEIIRIMTLDSWHLGKYVDDGWRKLEKNIIFLRPTAIALQNVDPVRFHLLRLSLSQTTGVEWNVVQGKGGESTDVRSVVISKYPMTEVDISAGQQNTKDFAAARIQHPRGTFVLFSVRIALTNGIEKACSGSCEEAFSDTQHQAAQVIALLAKATGVARRQRFTFIAGSLGSPSHRDWTEETKDTHCGCHGEWQATKMMEGMGFTDLYRIFYKDPKLYPGNTYSPVRKHKPQNRLDYIFYKNASAFYIPNVFTFCGLEPSKAESEFQRNEWPSDHCAVIGEISPVQRTPAELHLEQRAAEAEVCSERCHFLPGDAGGSCSPGQVREEL